jgi:excinuclease ABC subunit B
MRMNTHNFSLQSSFKPAGDQPEAIAKLLEGIKNKNKEQVLVGVTGSGKTFTMAQVIASVNRPTLIMSHNKTLAAQLYQEFRDFFPNNAVSYFVSYYDYYQPEAYLPQTDTYIEKETEINEDIDRLRLAATTNLLTRPDTIVIASVSCIYNIGSPREYGKFVLELKTGVNVSRDAIIDRLVDLQYVRNDWGFTRGTFRLRGETIDLYPSYDDSGIRIRCTKSGISDIHRFDLVTGKETDIAKQIVIYPAKHYMTDPKSYKEVFKKIHNDLDNQVQKFQSSGKLIEAKRIEQRVQHDLEMIREVGYVNGIENYSRYFDKRNPGDPPYTLFDYFKESNDRFYPDDPCGWLLFIDESHISVPQIKGMYNGDRSRKQTLIDYGFRLPSALDNRPLMFDEFLRRIPQTVYVSATPDEWEINRSDQIAEQLVRPTGLIDPPVSVRPIKGQIDDLIREIQNRIAKNQRVLVTTLTKRMAEDLTEYLKELHIRVQYLHSDVLTLERTERLAALRRGEFDVIVGVNLLREGLDLPEVSLVAILDADKEGFLRSYTSLIQTMGRAARHIKGEVILYADTRTKSIQKAVAEVERRRTVQLIYNKKYGITPESIVKPIRDSLVDVSKSQKPNHTLSEIIGMTEEQFNALTPKDKQSLIKKLRQEMTKASRDLNFELAARVRDTIAKLE